MPQCWKCNRDLGPMLEHQKMLTEKGPICYACFNALQEEAHRAEQARRATERTANRQGHPALALGTRNAKEILNHKSD